MPLSWCLYMSLSVLCLCLYLSLPFNFCHFYLLILPLTLYFSMCVSMGFSLIASLYCSPFVSLCLSLSVCSISVSISPSLSPSVFLRPSNYHLLFVLLLYIRISCVFHRPFMSICVSVYLPVFLFFLSLCSSLTLHVFIGFTKSLCIPNSVFICPIFSVSLYFPHSLLYFALPRNHI